MVKAKYLLAQKENVLKQGGNSTWLSSQMASQPGSYWQDWSEKGLSAVNSSCCLKISSILALLNFQVKSLEKFYWKKSEKVHVLEESSQFIHRGGSRGRVQGCAPPPPPHHHRDELRFSNTTGILRKKTMWFIGVEEEQETSAPPPKKNPGSAPD